MNIYDLSTWAALIGGLAFLVSVITEVTKNIGWLQRIPTDAQVILLAVGLCLAALLAAAEHSGAELTWYLPLGAVMGGFIVSFIAMYGWGTCLDLFQRLLPPGGKEETDDDW